MQRGPIPQGVGPCACPVDGKAIGLVEIGKTIELVEDANQSRPSRHRNRRDRILKAACLSWRNPSVPTADS